VPRHRRPRVAPGAVAVSAALLFAALAQPAFADAPVAFGITDTVDLLPGPAAAGQVGDFFLGNGDVAVIIEAPDHAHGDGLSGGNIVDAAAALSWSDQIDDAFTLLVTWPRQAVYDTVWIEADGSGGTAVVAASGVDSENGEIAVTTRYILDADERFVTVETALVNHGVGIGSYVAGDAITASYDDNFAPGYGFDIAGETTITEWIGWAGTSTSYAYTIDTDNFLADHGSAWSDAFVYDGDLPSGASRSYTRYLAIGANGLSSASDIVNGIREYPVGTVEGTVSDYFTGDPIDGATIDCLTYGTAHYTRILVGDSGDFSATLPAAAFDLQTNAEGYVRSVDHVTVSESVTSTLDITLWPTDAPIPKGDTLTVVMRPILSIPEIVTPGGSFVIEADADPSTSGWTARIERDGLTHWLPIASARYDDAYGRWYLTAAVPPGVAPELYDLTVEASGGTHDDVRHAVAVRDAIDDDFYFVQITDTHLPTHRFYYQPGADSDTTEMEDLHAVIDDINLIDPAFVLHTGDVVNEGELEDYLGWRVYTKAKRILGDLEVPVYVVAGNHDVGGWNSTPPVDGTARRNWWSFFGWRSLYDPPAADRIYTQNYTFDYGGAHFVGLEGYVNYDGWRDDIYGGESFTDRQMQWLADDLALADPSAPTILFYHYDFQHELDLDALGVDCALWGHIHETTGDIVAPPYDLSTGPVCDGRRLMRLVRVHGDTVLPSEPIAAGRHGETLTITYDPPNAGVAAHMTATILNQSAETFEHGLVKFRVPADSLPCAVTGGTLERTIVEGDVAVCYARVSIAPADTTVVAIEPVPQSLPDGTIALLKQSFPNPAQAGTTIRFVLAFPANVRIDVFDIAGRRVRTLTNKEYQAGESEVPWDLKNEDGLGVASGVYFYRLQTAGQSIAKKLAVIR
jgi:predicted MPP superfamily phosphohydrolase